jgi:hypothetical protein
LLFSPSFDAMISPPPVADGSAIYMAPVPKNRAVQKANRIG